MRVNLTSEEASSQSLEVIQSGTYVCNIVDGSIEEVKPGRKNVGKPYWKIDFVVQEGPYAGRHIFATVMLFTGAAYTLVQLLRALGYHVPDEGDVDIPELDEIIGKTVRVRGQKKPASTDPNGRDLPERFEVKGILAAPVKGSKTPTSSDLLP